MPWRAGGDAVGDSGVTVGIDRFCQELVGVVVVVGGKAAAVDRRRHEAVGVIIVQRALPALSTDLVTWPSLLYGLRLVLPWPSTALVTWLSASKLVVLVLPSASTTWLRGPPRRRTAGW